MAPIDRQTSAHHLILPRDANHHGTLYAGALMTMALESAYATAYRSVGASANLVLKRVLDLRCYYPIPVGVVAEILGIEVHRAQAQVVVALYGSPLPHKTSPWMDAIMQFVQVDDSVRPNVLPGKSHAAEGPLSSPWAELSDRSAKLLAIRR